MQRGSFIRFLAQLLTLDPEDEPGSLTTWIAREDESVLIDLTSGRVLAHICEDQRGKYSPMLFLAPLRAWRLWREHHSIVLGASLASTFPRAVLVLSNVKADSLNGAQDAIDRLLALLG